MSGAEQGKHGTSLDAQQKAIRGYCQAYDLPAPELFVEVESGAADKVERRVELRRILDQAEAGDTILVTRADRWSRDLVHAVDSVRKLAAEGIRWVAIHDSLDASTTQGMSTLGIMAWAADNERMRIRERTVGRRKGLRDEGYFVEGSAPTGYIWKGRTLTPDPETIPSVIRLFELACEGKSLREMGAVMRAEYPRQGWDPTAINRKIRYRYVLGEVQDADGNWIEGRHEAIIDRDTWQRANELIDSRRRTSRRRNSQIDNWIMGSIARCGVCGDHLSIGQGVSGPRRFFYLRCYRKTRRKREATKLNPGPIPPDCKGRFARADVVAEQLRPMVEARLRDLADRLADTRAAEMPRPPKTEARRAKLTSRRSSLIDMAADGVITRAELRKKLQEIDADIGTLDAEMRVHRQRVEAAHPEGRRVLLREVDNISQLWSRLTPARQREVMVRLAHEVVVVRGEPPVVKWKAVDELV